ncbi:MAG: glycosyltransferase [Candidatus Promineifilaceae bacterium]
MRIAIVCQSYPPMVSGAALLAEMLAKGLAANGHDVLVLAASDKRKAYVVQDGCLQIARLRSFHNPLRANQRSLLWPKKEIDRHLARFQPDIVHLHEPLALGWIALRWAQALSVPVALTLHQLPWFVSAYLPPLPGVRRAIEAVLWTYGRWFLRQCSAVIAHTHMTADEVAKRMDVRPLVIGAGTDLSHFNPRPPGRNESARLRHKYDMHPEQPILLHVGRLDADKQVERVIRAAAMVMQSETCQLLVVGDGHTRQKLIDLSRRLGIGDRCYFPGFITADGDLPGLYRMASLFVTASEIETFGLVILEAMAAGLPVVAPRVTCLPELVEDGQNGYLTPPADETAMADCMRLLLRNPEKAIKMGAVGRDKAVWFTAENMINQHEHLFVGLNRTVPARIPSLNSERPRFEDDDFNRVSNLGLF